MFYANKAVYICWLLFVGMAFSVQQRNHYVILGRAVNEQGKPVPFAHVVVASDPNDREGDPTYSGSANAEGHIDFDVDQSFETDDSTISQPTRLIYVTGPLPPSALIPFRPPFEAYNSLIGSKYLGRLIKIKKHGKIDIGDIPVSFFYGTVKVLLQDPSGAPLLRDARAWRYVWLRIRNSQAQQVSKTGLSKDDEQLLNLSESSVMVALPEGEWYVDISLHEDKGPWLNSESPIQVKASPQAIPLVLKQP